MFFSGRVRRGQGRLPDSAINHELFVVMPRILFRLLWSILWLSGEANRVQRSKKLIQLGGVAKAWPSSRSEHAFSPYNGPALKYLTTNQIIYTNKHNKQAHDPLNIPLPPPLIQVNKNNI